MNLHEKQCHKVVENNPGVSDHGLSITSLHGIAHGADDTCCMTV
jgi:hypothetical protein